MPDQRKQDQKQALNLIRFALLGGVVLFGGLAWFLGRVLEPEGMSPELFQGFENVVWYGFILFILGAFGGIIALQARWRAADGFPAKRKINIVGWALAEFPALLGGMYLMLGGDPTFFGMGLALMILAAFVLLPLPPSP